jgi:antitoxin CptB
MILEADPFSRTDEGDRLAPEDRVRRLQWRARRGLLENDLLLTRFFEKWSGRLTESDHDGLAVLLELGDNDLLDLVLGRKELSGEMNVIAAQHVLEKLRCV